MFNSLAAKIRHYEGSWIMHAPYSRTRTSYINHELDIDTTDGGNDNRELKWLKYVDEDGEGQKLRLILMVECYMVAERLWYNEVVVEYVKECQLYHRLAQMNYGELCAICQTTQQYKERKLNGTNNVEEDLLVTKTWKKLSQNLCSIKSLT